MITTTPSPAATLTPPRARPSVIPDSWVTPAAAPVIRAAGPVGDGGVTIRRRFTGSFAATCMGVTGTGWTEVAALQDMGRKLRAGSFAGR
jgi:hypothetical protein